MGDWEMTASSGGKPTLNSTALCSTFLHDGYFDVLQSSKPGLFTVRTVLTMRLTLIKHSDSQVCWVQDTLVLSSNGSWSSDNCYCDIAQSVCWTYHSGGGLLKVPSGHHKPTYSVPSHFAIPVSFLSTEMGHHAAQLVSCPFMVFLTVQLDKSRVRM